MSSLESAPNVVSGSVNWSDPVSMPSASGYLWNPVTFLRMGCRGFGQALHLQPEPAKYAYAPMLEAQTFLQPEAPVYAHHPGRFVYVKDRQSQAICSIPYEPVRGELDQFEFIVETDRMGWRVEHQQLAFEFFVTLAVDRPLELWTLRLKNEGAQPRELSVYPYFPVGYMSWMNQSADYSERHQGIICRAVTPYQRLEQYYRQQNYRDLTVLMADQAPLAWTARQSAFEGDGGLHRPDGVVANRLSNAEAAYETPTAVLQYDLAMAPDQCRTFNFVFGAVRDTTEATAVFDEYLSGDTTFPQFASRYRQAVQDFQSCLSIQTPAAEFDDFANHWLTRQIRYHGDTKRLTTDPQTRNFLQDAMGMSYLEPTQTRQDLLTTLRQQQAAGSLPDGVLLDVHAELKYINEVPHSDHAVWLPICLQAYLDETGDFALLDECVGFADLDQPASVFDHVNRALEDLNKQRDQRGLSLIGQGDWCDPMNMVGHQGKGVSSWLTLASAYAFQVWAELCRQHGAEEHAQRYASWARQCNQAVNDHFWDGRWYARGITDAGRRFGVAEDQQGRIFLNPQSWALLSGATDSSRRQSVLESVNEHLATPFGLQMLAPAYRQMEQDIGRLTQKHPGVAENGSVYNHASVFLVYALYQTGGYADHAFRLMQQMLPGPEREDLLQRGQLGVFLPNYYRGAWRSNSRTAGRSSQLINTGTVHWYYRCIVEGMFGLRGCREGLLINPQLPSHWATASCVRHFRGARFEIAFRRETNCQALQVSINGESCSPSTALPAVSGQHYQVQVNLPVSRVNEAA